MNHKSRRRKRLLAGGMVVLFLSCLAGCNRRPPELPRATDVVRIRLEVFEPGQPAPARAAVLEDRRDVERLLSLAALARKPPCLCHHLEEVVFETSTSAVRASICGHCFDVRTDGHVTCYAMSPGFYSAFQDLLAEREKPATK